MREGLQASSPQLRAAALVCRHRPWTSLGPRVEMESVLVPGDPGAGAGDETILGEKKAGPYSSLGGSAGMPPICKNLGLNVNKCLLKTVF